MAILTFEQRHDLGKALLFCLCKIYSALYVHLDFRTNFNMSTCTCTQWRVQEFVRGGGQKSECFFFLLFLAFQYFKGVGQLRKQQIK